MSTRSCLAVAVLWVASLVVVAVVASAQVARPQIPLREPKVITGADLGFRVTSMHGDVPAGQLVVRVNGEWVEAELGGLPPSARQRVIPGDQLRDLPQGR